MGVTNLPPEQEAIRAKCFHPTGKFEEFPREDVETSIPARFEKIVRMYPDRIAVKIGSRVVTYAELNSMANRLAHAIVALHGDKAAPIALLYEKGIEQIAAMLGVLKASKFFVLLDPSVPRVRIATLLRESQAALLITGPQSPEIPSEAVPDRCRRLEFDAIDSAISGENLTLNVSQTALACVTYTSGSTGEPKGVMQNHRNLLHGVMVYTNSLHVCAHDRIALLPSSTANAVTNSLVALLTGAALFPLAVQKEGAVVLRNWLVDEEISVCWMISSLFRTLCHTLTGKERFPHLRLVRLTAEVYKADIDLYRKYFSPRCILAYGFSSSETGISRIVLIDRRTEITGNDVPAGYPVDDKDIRLLDDASNDVGFNEIGEIAVRSRYLSPGYWRNPDLTKAKFKPASNHEERLYLSGDLGLMLPDRGLIFKGRKDFRVKIRGYRVSLIEVEAVLAEHPQVREAAVVAWNAQGSDRYLAAYVVSWDSVPTVSELSSFLRERLPEYMIPTAFAFLKTLPKTNGKTDRRSLPPPERARPTLDQAYTPETNDIEQQLVQIWELVLNIHPVGIHDNFFELGGHSLAATRVVSQVIKQFQIEVPLQLLFQSPTVAEMAAVITEHRAKKLGREDLDRMLAGLESISDEEARRLLANQPVAERR